jgi:hypothetical protein
VSIDADAIQDADVEMVYDDASGSGDDEGLLFAQPSKVIFHGGRISAATLCDIPAFAEAYVALTDDAGAVVAGGAMDRSDWDRAVEEAPAAPLSLVAYAAPVIDYAPPASWFQNPGLSLWTDITVTADGRVYGHAAQAGSCHIGYADQCVTMPVEDYHAYYLTGEVLCDNGASVPVGQITIATGHASMGSGPKAAADHYDHTGTVVADVTTGTDSVGIWVAGAIRPDADPAKVAALRASGRVSGGASGASCAWSDCSGSTWAGSRRPVRARGSPPAWCSPWWRQASPRSRPGARSRRRRSWISLPCAGRWTSWPDA